MCTRGKWEGPRDYVIEKRDIIPWAMWVEGKESWHIRIVVGLET
jgi:hypothetical protein